MDPNYIQKRVKDFKVPPLHAIFFDFSLAKKHAFQRKNYFLQIELNLNLLNYNLKKL